MFVFKSKFSFLEKYYLGKIKILPLHLLMKTDLKFQSNITPP